MIGRKHGYPVYISFTPIKFIKDRINFIVFLNSILNFNLTFSFEIIEISLGR